MLDSPDVWRPLDHIPANARRASSKIGDSLLYQIGLIYGSFCLTLPTKNRPLWAKFQAGLSIRGLALTELARITVSASYSNSDRREARRNPANA
jgi:hypothetical protein